MQELIFEVEADSPVSLRSYLRGQGVSARLLTRLKLPPNQMLRNGIPIRSIDLVAKGDRLVLRLVDAHFLDANAALAVPIVYEDASTVVFHKPAGMPVHPSVKHQGDTLGNFFASRYPTLTFRPVNRLDRDTSGLCIVAKSAYAAHQLQGGIAKRYYAVVVGILNGDGTIDAPIARETDTIILRCVRADGRHAVTRYHVLGHTDMCTAVEVTLETGRTHQIRVHFSHIGHPLLGDSLYGGDCTQITGQALHCGSLTFTDCLTGMQVCVTAPCPQEMRMLVPGIL